MRAVRQSFLHMILMIKQDFMLLAACLAPLLCGLVFKLGVPLLEQVLADSGFNLPSLSPYYGLFDLTFSILTPTMLCFASAMFLLEETDDRISKYLFVTPLGKRGYLLARLFLPALISFGVTCLLLPVFSLSNMPPLFIFATAASASAQALISVLLIVTFSSNKLEGMATAKLSSVIVVGMFVPFFLKDPVQYWFALLPSYWMGKAVYDSNILYFLLSLLLCLLYCILLIKLFLKKAEK